MSNETNVVAEVKKTSTKKTGKKDAMRAKMNDASKKTKIEKKIVQRTKRDVFGNRLATRGHAINVSVLTLLAKGKKCRAVEIEMHVNGGMNKVAEAYKKLSGEDVKAIRNHLLALVTESYLKFDDETKQYSMNTKKTFAK